MKTNDRKQKIIQKIKKINFRQEIEKTIDIFTSLWRLAKWAKDKNHLSRDILKMLILKFNNNTIDTFEKKVNMFKNVFFYRIIVDRFDRHFEILLFQFDRVFLERYENERPYDHQAIRSMKKKVPSINDHIYNSLFWLILNRLIESCRTSSRLTKFLHYWVRWRSPTRKSRSRDVRGEVSSQNASKKINFSQQHCQFSSIFRSVFEIFIESTLLFYISTLFSITKTKSSRYNAFVFVYLFTTTFEVRRNKLCEYLRSAILERINFLKSYEGENTRDKIDQSFCFESKNFVCCFIAWFSTNYQKNQNKSEKSSLFLIISNTVRYELDYTYFSDENDVM
jgi:hypothetical protein